MTARARVLSEYGAWETIREVEPNKAGSRMIEVRCKKCGDIHARPLSLLNDGRTRRCKKCYLATRRRGVVGR